MPALATDKFKKSKRKFETTVGVGGILAGGTTLPLTSVTGLDTSTAVTLVVGAGTATEEVITGVVSGSDLINCVRGKEGTTDSAHSAGETVNMFFTETHWDDAMDGILVEHDQDGTHGAVTASSVTATTGTFTNLTIAGTATPEGWSALGATPDTVTALGNRSYSMVFNGTDLTDTLSPGMRLKMTRTVTAPTQCTDLESGSSQYYSKTSPNKLSFTDDFTCMGWVKLESYSGGGIIARRNADTEGWSLGFTSDGRLQISALRIAGNNVSCTAYQSVPLGKWVHVAGSMDLSGTSSLLYVDGVLIPSVTVVTGTCTALVQGTTALVVGALKSAGTNPFDGKIAQAGVFDAVLSATTIRSYMSQTLSGSETNCKSAYSFSNSIADLNTTTPNDLTAQGSALATATDTPFAGGSVGTTEYAIVTAATFSTNTTLTVQVPEGGAIPTSGGVSAMSYSTYKIPYGFPSDIGKWRISSLALTTLTTSFGATNTWTASEYKLTIPIGAWSLTGQVNSALLSTVSGVREGDFGIYTAAELPAYNVYIDQMRAHVYYPSSSYLFTRITMQKNINLTSSSTYIFYAQIASSTGTETFAPLGGSEIYADLAYV